MDSPIPCAAPPNRLSNLWQLLIDRFRQLCGYRFPRLGPVAFATILRTLPSIIEIRLFPNVNAVLDLRDETQRTTYSFGTRFEEPTPQILREWAADATHFFDIGSNYGFYTFFLHSLFPQLRIYPFEPNPVPFRRLVDICASNRSAGIHPQPYGLSDQEQRLRFLQLADNTGHSSFATAGAYADGSPIPNDASFTECDVVQFSEATKRLGLEYPTKPNWVAKIDVEGYEMKVLLGMTEALSKRVFKGICIELFADNLALCDASVKQVDALLQSYDYHQMPSRGAGHDRPPGNHNAFYVPAETATILQPASSRNRR